eukprot:5001595-Pyramimonas_sp.AAC.1
MAEGSTSEVKRGSTLPCSGAFRAVRIILWISIAYDADNYVPHDMLYDLAGPNVKQMEQMCPYAGL